MQAAQDLGNPSSWWYKEAQLFLCLPLPTPTLHEVKVLTSKPADMAVAKKQGGMRNLSDEIWEIFLINYTAVVLILHFLLLFLLLVNNFKKIICIKKNNAN